MRHDEPKPSCRRCGQPKPKGRGRKLCDRCTSYLPASQPAPQNTCNACKDPVPPGRQYCDECRDLRRWSSKRRNMLRKRKPCRGCGGAKGPGPRRRLCDRCLRAKQPALICVLCQKRPRRYPTARLCVICKDTEPARARARRAAWAREHAATRPSGKTNLKIQRETARMGRRLREERDGKARAPVDPETYVRAYGSGRGVKTGVRVDPAPLKHLLEPLDPLVVAAATGLSGSYINRILNGTYDDGIFVVDADRLCTYLGQPLGLTFPELAA